MLFLAIAPVKKDEPAIFLLRLAFFPLIRWPPQERLYLTLPEAVILTLLLRPLCVFCFGISAITSKRLFSFNGINRGV